ncbi:MAG: class I SAM-dependent methyltransferase [Alphaproteobacteria bacterium]|nr:class I SAM-dependent methyltransferase [Alphaproteobacteria bacterium]
MPPDISQLHTRFFTVLTELFPGVQHLHYGVSDEPRAGLLTMPFALREGPWRTLAYLVEAGELDLLDAPHTLDVGCGVGGTALFLAEHLGHQVTGLNITQVQVDRARENVAAAGLEGRVEVVCGDACAMPFPDASFDAVTLIECAFHVADKPALFGEIARVLKPGGRLVMADQIRADAPLEVMGLFFFVAEGDYEALAADAGLNLGGMWDLSHEIATWMTHYARLAATPVHGLVAAWALLRLRPALAWRYLSGVAWFNALLREDFEGRGIRTRPWSNALRALREHTRDELDDGRSSYRIWRFDKPPHGTG